MDPIDALSLCGGAARWSRLCELGVPDAAIRAAVRAGAAQALDRGAYALPDAPSALTAAVRLSGAASHVSAARLHGWPTWNRDERVVVTVPHATSRSLPGVTIYRAPLPRIDVERYRPCTGYLRTALDCARTLSLVDAVCVLDAALRCCAVGEQDLAEAASRARGPGVPALRQAVANADPRAASPLESALRLLLRSTGARLQSQVWIRGIGTVDFVVDEWLIVESDGFAFHSDRDAYRNDRRRGNGAAVGGFAQLRFTWEDVRFRPEWVVAEVERVRRLRAAR